MKLIFLVLLCAIFVPSCVSIAGDLSFDEVSIVTSPDGRADALLIETNGGATTSFGYLVFVVPKGVRLRSKDEKYLIASLYGATRNNSAYGANLKWPTKEKLLIEHLAAKSSEIIESKVNFAGYEVSVELKSGVADPSALPGGMLYNLSKATNANR
jgi:hypothetical protein